MQQRARDRRPRQRQEPGADQQGADDDGPREHIWVNEEDEDREQGGDRQRLHDRDRALEPVAWDL